MFSALNSDFGQILKFLANLPTNFGSDVYTQESPFEVSMANACFSCFG